MAQQYSMEIERYLTALKGMYSDVRNWIEGASISVQETTLEIAEEHRGKYDAPSLRLIDAAGGSIVILQPIGTRIIGASGRVDFIGNTGKESVVLLDEGGPSMIMTIGVGDDRGARVSPVYKGVTKAGWYWIEDKIRAEAHLLDKKVFWEIIAQVSDYEYSL
jgi:hypothetical protein